MRRDPHGTVYTTGPAEAQDGNERRLRQFIRLLALVARSPRGVGRTLDELCPTVVDLVLGAVVWLWAIGTPVACRICPSLRVRLALAFGIMALRRGESVCRIMDRHFSAWLHSNWRAVLRQAEEEGKLPEALEWLSRQPLPSAVSHQAWPEKLALGIIPLALISVLIEGQVILVEPKVLWMTQEMSNATHALWTITTWRNDVLQTALWLLFLVWGLALLRLLHSFRLWSDYLLVVLPLIGRHPRWRRQAELATAMAWSLHQQPQLAAALELALAGTNCLWTRRKLRRALTRIVSGEDWLAVWRGEKLVDASDAWLLSQGWRSGQPRAAWETLAKVLQGRLNYWQTIFATWLRVLVVLLMGLLVGLHVMVFFWLEKEMVAFYMLQ
jgi:type II secretory pathway component PulF